MIKQKGGAGFAVGLAIAEVIHAVALDGRRMLPVSTLQDGSYGIRDVALSLPTVVGRGGALTVQQVDLWPRKPRRCEKAACCVKRSTRRGRVRTANAISDVWREMAGAVNAMQKSLDQKIARILADPSVPRTSSWPTPRMPTWPSASRAGP